MKCLFGILIMILSLLGCKKQDDWLNKKRQKSDVVPETLYDFQALLDNTMLMNSIYPTIGLVGCDNFYFPEENITSLDVIERNAYLWNKDIFGNENSIDYSNGYNIISWANIVLERLQTFYPASNISESNNIKGQALFYRSIIFYELANTFCKPYNGPTASTDLGLCVRLKSDIHHIEQRSSVQQTYNQMIDDLKTAAALLPVTPLYRTRPCKPAALALLSRVYLLMDDYERARSYADSSLSYFNDLMDFNDGSVSLSKPYRFPKFNEGNAEIIFYASGAGYGAFIPNEASNHSYIDSLFLKAYSENDLRKDYFFSVIEPGKAKFRGTYTGNDRTFTGIATNEIYFIRAECNARLNNIDLALADLNKVLERRHKQNSYSNFVSTDREEVLRKVLEERRKEFPATGQIRWQDLRRLNKDPRFSKTLHRNVHGIIYSLNPDDPRYVYPLPQQEIDLGGLQQNQR